MFIDDETAGRNKRDNFPKDRAILSLVLPSLDGLSLDMMVTSQEHQNVHCVTVWFALLTASIK